MQNDLPVSVFTEQRDAPPFLLCGQRRPLFRHRAQQNIRRNLLPVFFLFDLLISEVKNVVVDHVPNRRVLSLVEIPVQLLGKAVMKRFDREPGVGQIAEERPHHRTLTLLLFHFVPVDIQFAADIQKRQKSDAPCAETDSRAFDVIHQKRSAAGTKRDRHADRDSDGDAEQIQQYVFCGTAFDEIGMIALSRFPFGIFKITRRAAKRTALRKIVARGGSPAGGAP